MLRLTFLASCVILIAAARFPSGSLAQEAKVKDQGHAHHGDGHSSADLNKQFLEPDLDVKKFVDRFESDSREIFAQRRKIVEALELAPGQVVADIGAGTGAFSWLLAAEVGPQGKVYAVDIAPAFVEFIGKQAVERGLESVVKPIRSTQEATNLAPGSIDVAFVCATYHHFEDPSKVLTSIHQALRPGGRLVIIDFDLREDSTAHVRERARAPKEVYFREIEAAGFVAMDAKPSLGLKENFFAAFRRCDADAQGRVPGDK
jgi:ubiquinone/menaquinone biosynthesis C-methylase UbiE